MKFECEISTSHAHLRVSGTGPIEDLFAGVYRVFADRRFSRRMKLLIDLTAAQLELNAVEALRLAVNTLPNATQQVREVGVVGCTGLGSQADLELGLRSPSQWLRVFDTEAVALSWARQERSAASDDRRTRGQWKGELDGG